MGWVVFWAAVIVLLLLAWFVPVLRRRSSPGAPDGPGESVLREAERHRGLAGGSHGPGGGSWGS